MGNTASLSTSKYPGQRRSDQGSVPPSGGGVAGSTTTSNTNSSSSEPRSASAGQRGSSPPASTAAKPMAGPGAFSVDRSSGPTSVYRVTVPDGVRSGQEFQVYAGTRLVRVRCPHGIRPGQSLQITVPSDPTVTPSERPAMLHSAGGGSAATAPVDTPEHLLEQQRRLNGEDPAGPTSSSPSSGNSDEGSNHNSEANHNTMNNHNHNNGNGNNNNGPAMITIPEGVRPGQQFPVTLQGQHLMVTCPKNARPGMVVRINRPPQVGRSLDRPPPSSGNNNDGFSSKPDKPQTQLFEVVVPKGVKPKQPFALMAGGQRVLVTCPSNAGPGQRIRFELPINLLHADNTKNNRNTEIEKVRLSYGKDGWTRTIRVSDMKFQWIRVDGKGDVDLRSRFDINKSAYVRKLDFSPGLDPRVRGGRLSLVPATQAVVDSKVPGPDGRDVVSYSDIAKAQVSTFDEKTEWFFETCSKLRVEYDEGHMRVNVRRDYLLSDSMMAVMSLSRKDLRKTWKFEFIGEEGIDAGGLAREWFLLVTKDIFNPDNGLWQFSAANQLCMDINPASEVYHPEDHLVYFRFLGRVLGKALFDCQLVDGHMVRHLYKHLLGWPITFEDLQLVDEELYANLRKTSQMDEKEVEYLCLDFTATESYLGENRNVQLINKGAEIEVTADNLPEYMECQLKYRMLGRVKAQLTELMLGFFDVLPEPLLTVFDFQELELLMCGLPEIDMEDWMLHTEYKDEFASLGRKHQVVKWFWEVVSNDLDREHKARLVQFVTGTSGVPSRGFSVLQGSDGNIRRFTVLGLSREIASQDSFPRAHTCFNRIDLPLYNSKAQLRSKLTVALEMAATGFDIE